MSNLVADYGLSNGDIFAVVLFLGIIGVFNTRVEAETSARPSTYSLMLGYRRAWMQVLLTRESRIVDAQILGNLQASARFFASGMMLAIGGTIAMISGNEAFVNLGEIFPISHEAWAIKLFFVALVLANGFLKFIWSNRLFGYAAIVMAAIPETEDGGRMAERASQLLNTASKSFNRGLRMIYFALAALCWLLGAWAFFAATCFVAYVIWRREFASQSRQYLKEE